ncbi:hypothetical protein CGGC5_v016127 [Colletotrichum fructicola Nara gc5]|uniref:Uncharacterized protein n=1 Tax=Colletotrichum fructicola (strain Nara gc5) TaxID=1213859 RepID=A0A7J6IF19_COLFN|nr:hypothetical protein CGGC5_v016127 [Colletotrichum fructicola Nara gc5]
MAELDDHREGSVWPLAATLLLCLAEVCLGDSRRWLFHLHGARSLLLEANTLSGPMHALIEIYNYLACMASITSDNAPEQQMSI